MKKILIILIFIIIIPFKGKTNIQTMEKIYEINTSGFYHDKDTQSVKEPYLYFVNEYGLEIYEIEDSGNTLLKTRLPLYGDARSISIKDTNAYIISFSYYNPYYIIYKVDISNPSNPYIDDEIYFKEENSFSKGYIFNNYLLAIYSDIDYNFNLKIIKIPELKYVDDYPYTGTHFIQFNDSTAIKKYQNNIYKIYDFGNPTNINELGQINLSGTSLNNPKNFIMINNNTVVSISDDGMAFWDITDFYNWNLVSTINNPPNTFWGENICVKNQIIFVSSINYYSNTSIASIDISDINSPDILDRIYLNSPYIFYSLADMSKCNNSIFVGTWSKIYQLIHKNGLFKSQEEIYENHHTNNAQVYNNYLIVSFDYGIGIYDISNPHKIEKIFNMFEDNYISSIKIKDNIMAFIDYDEDKLKVYSIDEITNPYLLNEIQLNTSSSVDQFYLPNTNSIYYLSQNPNPKLNKYNISHVGSFNLGFSFELETDGKGFIYNDHFYYLANYDDRFDLQIIKGLKDNEPELCENLYNFAPGFTSYGIINDHDYFYIYERDMIYDLYYPHFYKIKDSTDIHYKFTTSKMCSGDFFIKDNQLYTSGYFSNINIYDLEDIEDNIIEPVDNYKDYSFSLDCIPYEIEDEEYIFHIQACAISVYKNKMESINFNSVLINSYLISHPNPFTTYTTISFTSSKPINKNNKIEIYNIKGQKVRSLTLTQDEMSENGNLSYLVNWNGKNKNNKEVAPGIYFCKIKTAENTFVSKMLRVE